jgi:hypothetical protein
VGIARGAQPAMHVQRPFQILHVFVGHHGRQKRIPRRQTICICHRRLHPRPQQGIEERHILQPGFTTDHIHDGALTVAEQSECQRKHQQADATHGVRHPTPILAAPDS